MLDNPTDQLVRDRMFYWIRERESIRIRKSLHLSPLTDNPILATMRFCNVDREQDAVTRWVKIHVRDRYINLPIPQQIAQLTAARIFNHPEVLEMILPLLTEADYATALVKLQARKQEKLKILRGAYLMPPHRKGTTTIEDYWLSVVLYVSRQEFACTTLADYADVLIHVHGLGPFLVNQLAADLRYMPIGKDAPDWETFLLCGPGTVRGLNRVHTGSAKAKLGNPKQYAALVLELRNMLVEVLPDLKDVFRDPNNVANCLCEFDKYERVRENLLAENPRRIKMRKY
jgi:hypothetical protein